MIEPLSNRILVKVNTEQKDYAEFGGVQLFLANEFNTNYRERNPVLAYVVKGNSEIKDGVYVVVHHNHFSQISPFDIGEGYYSIPYNETIFAIIDENGNPQSVCDNIIAERIEEDLLIGLANAKRLHYHDRVVVISDGFGYKNGQEIFTLPFSDYEIVYNWNGKERRIIKVYCKDIVAVLKN